MTVSFAAGVLSLLLAVAAVYQSWRQNHTAWWLAGLGLLTVAVIIFGSGSTGWEYGLVYALFLPGLLVWVPIARERTYKQPKPLTYKPRALSWSPATWGSHLANALVVLVGQLMCSLLISLALCRLIPVDFVGQMALTVLLTPLLWGLFIYQFLGLSKRWMCFLYQVIAAGLCSLLLVVS